MAPLSKKTQLEESTMCHQCQRNDRGPVVRCMKCKTERYCHECLNWYPHLSHTEVARSCPVCRGNCNCKQCLRSKGNSKEKSKSERKVIEDEKINYSKYLLHQLLPVLKEIDQEQVMEKEVEARIRGISLTELEVQQSDCKVDERAYCNNCKT